MCRDKNLLDCPDDITVLYFIYIIHMCSINESTIQYVCQCVCVFYSGPSPNGHNKTGSQDPFIPAYSTVHVTKKYNVSVVRCVCVCVCTYVHMSNTLHS